MTVTGTSEFNGTVDVDANFAVRSGTTDKFTVASSSGNVSTDGTLTVAGQTDLNGHVNIGDTTADIITINSAIDSNLNPDATGNNRDIGNTIQKWRDGYFSGTVTAPTLAGNVNIASGTSTFNNVTVNGLVTGNISGNAGTATALETARNIGGVSFNGTANIDLPGVNTGGNQNTSGTATQADNINIDETNSNTTYQVTFSAQNNSGYNRQYIDTDNGHLTYNPSTQILTGLKISSDDVQSSIFGTASQNAYGARTVSTGNPAGGSDGDIWYKY